MEYQIEANTRRCASTGQELQPGDKFYSVLVEESGRLVRLDYASDAWQGPPHGAFSFWSGRVPQGEHKRRAPIDDESAERLFHPAGRGHGAGPTELSLRGGASTHAAEAASFRRSASGGRTRGRLPELQPDPDAVRGPEPTAERGGDGQGAGGSVSSSRVGTIVEVPMRQLRGTGFLALLLVATGCNNVPWLRPAPQAAAPRERGDSGCR